MSLLKKIAERLSLKPFRMQVLSALQENTTAIRDLHGKIFADNPVAIIRNAKMYLPLHYVDHIQKIIYQTGDFYEIETLNFLSLHYKSFDKVMDIGSNIGNHALFYCTGLKAKTVHCFEPNAYNLQTLKENVRLNHLEQSIHIHPVALGAETGKGIQQNFALSNTGMNRVEKVVANENQEEVVEIKTLDEYNFDNIDFIKIDVEGFEMEVLKGARQTLQASNAVLLIEVFDERKAEVDTFLRPLGYRELITLEDYNVIYTKENPVL